MCGRFTLAVETRELEDAFAVAATLRLPPRFNIAPTQQVAAVRLGARGRELVELRWGLIPRWADDPRIGNRLINARSETASEKPSFRDAFARRRCVVPATGFYEWRTVGRKKIPHVFRRRDGMVFAMAGLWERWRSPNGPVETCTLLTRQSVAPIDELHDRMPVIFAPEEIGGWLDPARDPGGESLHLPFDGEAWEVQAVNPALNDPRNESADCIAPWDESAS